MTPTPPFFMPAEWQPHSRCWMAWPCNPAIWPNGMEAAHRAFARVVCAIAEFEPVSLLVRPEHLEDARRLCGSGVDFIEYALDDSWMRDFGPSFVIDSAGQLAGVDWRFNGWGKYPHARDRHVARFILGRERVPRLSSGLVLEGGAFHVDGEGTALTTAQCVLNDNRNPGLSREAVQAELQRLLGVERLIWLERGLADDDTDGHVDELACFVAPGVVLAMVGSDPGDCDYPVLRDNLAVLRAARDARGRSLEVVTVEQPRAAFKRGLRLSQSYVNFYLANGAVIMPAFEDPPRDDAARGTLAELFPERRIVQLPGRDLAYGGGNIHCITQQQPQVAACSGS